MTLVCDLISLSVCLNTVTKRFTSDIASSSEITMTSHHSESFVTKESKLEDSRAYCEYDFRGDATVLRMESLMNIVELEVGEETVDYLLENSDFMIDVDDLIQLMDDDLNDWSTQSVTDFDGHLSFGEELQHGSYSTSILKLLHLNSYY